MQRRINVNKLSRYNLPESALSPEMEMQKALLYVQEYLQGLPCGKELPKSELQPADDLATLAAHAFVSVWTVTRDEKHLINAAAVLEFGLTKSVHAFQMRLMLVQIYRLLGESYFLRSCTGSLMND